MIVTVGALLCQLALTSTTFIQVTEPVLLNETVVDFSVAQFGHLPRNLQLNEKVVFAASSCCSEVARGE